MAWSYQTDFEKYTKAGYKTSSYYLKLSYFDASILEGGELYLEKVEVNAQVWKKVDIDDKVNILFLKEKPEKPTLEISTKPENFVPFERYESAWVVLGIGIFLVSTALILSKVFQVKITRNM